MYINNFLACSFSHLLQHKNSIYNLDPLEFSQLPTEIKFMILEQAAGFDLGQTLSNIELVSKEWAEIARDLWPKLIERSFTGQKLELARTFIRAGVSPGVIYRLLLTRAPQEVTFYLNREKNYQWESILPTSPLGLLEVNNVSRFGAQFNINTNSIETSLNINLPEGDSKRIIPNLPVNQRLRVGFSQPFFEGKEPKPATAKLYYWIDM